MEIEAQNAIYLGEETGGRGRQFRARFLVPGLVKYDYGVCLLTKENADKFIQGFTGCPVVINHQNVTDDNVKDVAVGDIFSVWFDNNDGYYWCNGIIRDKEAIKLINEGYSVSCQYLITEYSDNTKGALHNGNPYDKVIENGKPEHLAIVNNPRYEGAIIAVNAIMAENEAQWITIKPNGEDAKGRHLLVKDGETPSDAVRRVYGDKNQKTLFDTKEYRKTKEDFKKEDAEKQKQYDKIEERKKEAEKLDKEAAEKAKKEDALSMEEEEFVSKYFNKVPGNSIWQLYDYWQSAQKDKKEQSQKESDKEENKENNFEKETKTTKKDENRQQKVRDLEDKAYKEFKKTYDNYINGSVKISDFGKAKEQFNKKYKDAFDKLESDRFVSFEDLAKRENKQPNKESKKQDKSDDDNIPKAYSRSEKTKLLYKYKTGKISRDEWIKETEKLNASNSFIDQFKDTLYTVLAAEIFDCLGE